MDVLNAAISKARQKRWKFNQEYNLLKNIGAAV